MEKFTVKDFITYYNPCFGCRKPVNFKIGIYDTESKADVYYIRPVVTLHCTEIDLKITYADSIRLYIFHKTNKILTNNSAGLEKYLKVHQLFLATECNICAGKSETHLLEFDLKKNHVLPATIMSERLVVTDKETVYMVDSSFGAKTSKMHIYKKKTASSNDINLTLPLLPKSKFKDRKQFLEKMKLYVLFS
jgi:hypothetical protein